jgi:hypothetical protein
MLSEDGDLLKTIIEQTVQQVLEAEMEEALQAGKGERSEQRLGYRARHSHGWVAQPNSKQRGCDASCGAVCARAFVGSHLGTTGQLYHV